MDTPPHNPIPPTNIVRTEQGRSFTRKWRAGQSRQRSIFFLGAGQLQLPGICLAREMGLRVHTADGNPTAPGVGHSDTFHHVDLKDAPALVETARNIQTRNGLDAVLTIGTDFSVPVAQIAEACTLPGISVEAALNASRKDRMRHLLKDAGFPVPNFAVIDKERSLESLEEALRPLRYPLVSKPSNNMGARGVRELHSPADLPEALAESRSYSRNGPVLIEEKIIGREYSLDSLLHKGQFHPMGIARRYIDYPPYFIERGHSFPSDLSREQEDEMFQTLHRAALLLGIHSGAAKGDIFFTDDGPVIGEIAARLSGGFMSGWTFPLHSGLDPAIAAILIALGEALPPDLLSPLHSLPVSERCLISVPGTIHAVLTAPPANPDTATRPSPEQPCHRFISAQTGDHKSFPRNNVEKCGNIICCGEPGQAEKLVASYFLPLQMEGPAHLQKLLADPFPPAYPILLEKLRHSDIKLSDIDIDMDNADHSAPVPDFMLNSPERDWNYRTIGDSLAALRQFLPDFSWHQHKEKAGGWHFSTSHLNLLSALLKGGFQTALYYIELDQKTSEKKTEPYWNILLPGVYNND